jgi:UDP-N-acetylmuramoylalanine--D-glutamate ligase
MDQRSKIAVLGFGVEGQSILKYLLKHGYNELTVCDQNVDLEIDLEQGVSVRLGPEYLDALEDFDVIFRSPGISYLNPLIQSAVNQNVEVTSAINYFMDQCPGVVVGVSGTKGKGTTSTLIYEMLKTSGKSAGEDLFLGGNIGKSPLEFLDKVKADGLVVLELSSFQLQDLAVAPQYAVMLNTTSDHLDYHADREEYMEAKERLLSEQKTDDVAILNKDYEYYKYYKNLVKGSLKEVSVDGKVSDGAFVDDGILYLASGGKKEEIVAVEEVKLVGSHNLENILPAMIVAEGLGVKVKDIKEVVRSFENLPYRLQFVREVGGIKFYNDSFSTNAETSMAAVDSFEDPTVLIAGGYDKGLDYNDWAVKILTRESLHTVILMGDLAEKMEEALINAEEKLGDAEGSPTKILRRKTMEAAVIDAFAESDEGGVVVLSPAAASFDMYENYKARGNDFVAHVRKLK